MKALDLHVHSSFIVEAVYFEVKQTLRLRIKNTWYYYYGITPQKVARFRKAHSKGGYFCRFIKGKYEVMKRTIR
jgi:hypothetical protein